MIQSSNGLLTTKSPSATISGTLSKRSYRFESGEFDTSSAAIVAITSSTPADDSSRRKFLNAVTGIVTPQAGYIR